MNPRFDVHQHLTVLGVLHEGSTVQVELREQSGARQRIDFRFADAAAAAEQAVTLTEWRDLDRRLTYVRGAAQGVLLDDEEVFRTAFDGDGHVPR